MERRRALARLCRADLLALCVHFNLETGGQKNDILDRLEPCSEVKNQKRPRRANLSGACGVCGEGLAAGCPSPCPLCRLRTMDPFHETTEMVHHWLPYPGGGVTCSVQRPDVLSPGEGFFLRMVKIHGRSEQVWPRTLVLKVNGVVALQVTAPEGQPRRDLPYSLQLSPGENSLEVRSSDGAERMSYALAVVRTQERSVEALQQQVRSLDRSEALIKLAAMLAPGDQEEVTCSLTEMPLHSICPLTLERLRVPARGRDCPHLQCFELEAFLRTAAQTGAFNKRWMCPVCSRRVLPDSLVREEFVASLLPTLPDDPVWVDASGAWKSGQDVEEIVIDDDDDDDEEADALRHL